MEELAAALGDRFRPLRVLGRGGMATVLVARDRELAREVAVKVLHLSPSPALRARLAREARALASLRSPHLAEVYDFDAHGALPWISMELLEGHDLRTDPTSDPLAALLEVGEGLTVAHRAGVVHRDVKPDNMFRSRDGRTLLIDFGLALHHEDTRLTGTDLLVGTPAFLAPELILGEEASPGSDWFAWGMSLYWCLEGCYPTSSDEVVFGASPGGPGPTFEQVDPEAAVAEVIRRCLAFDPADRPAGLGEIRSLLEAPASPEDSRRTAVLAPAPAPVAAEEPAAAPRRGRALAVLAGLGLVSGGLLGVAGLRWSGGRGPAPAPGTPAPRGPTLPATPVASEDLPPHDTLVAQVLAATDPATALGRRVAAWWRERGARAYVEVPAIGRWYRWLDGGGNPADLPTEALASIAAADAQAAALGRVVPFGAGWRGRASTRMGHLDLEARLEEVDTQVRAHRRKLWSREDGLGHAAALSGTTRSLVALLTTSARDAEGRRRLDDRLGEPRRAVRALAGTLFRALAEAPPARALELQARGRTALAGGWFLMAGSLAGARARWILGGVPANPWQRVLELDLQGYLGRLARAQEMAADLPEVPPEDLAEAWMGIVEDRSMGPLSPVRLPPTSRQALRAEAWVRALDAAKDHGGRRQFEDLLARGDEELRAAMSPTLQAGFLKLLEWHRGRGG